MADRRERATALARTGVLVVAVAMLALTGCGSSRSSSATSGSRPAAGVASGEEPGADGRPWTMRPWVAVEPTEDADRVQLAFWGPDATSDERCAEEREVHASPSDDGDLDVSVIVSLDEDDRPADDCPWSLQRLPLELERPLGSRLLTDPFSDRAVRAVDGGFELVAETTSCGRVDCSTPSPEPASCDPTAMRTAFDTEIDGGILPDGEPRCDGSFLVTDIDLGSSSCVPSEGAESPCKKVKRAYFVANAGAWRIVTYGMDETCESVLHVSGIRFPPALCS